MLEAIRLIKAHEGVRLQAYRCPAGVWTVGYGHTAGVTEQTVITRTEAERLLLEDLAVLNLRLENMGLRDLSLRPEQRAALLSFAYNVGIGAFGRSTLWRLVRADPDNPAIADEFARWVYADGRKLKGLVKRRRAEAELYFRRED